MGCSMTDLQLIYILVTVELLKCMLPQKACTSIEFQSARICNTELHCYGSHRIAPAYLLCGDSAGLSNMGCSMSSLVTEFPRSASKLPEVISGFRLSAGIYSCKFFTSKSRTAFFKTSSFANFY